MVIFTDFCLFPQLLLPVLLFYVASGCQLALSGRLSQDNIIFILNTFSRAQSYAAVSTLDKWLKGCWFVSRIGPLPYYLTKQIQLQCNPQVNNTNYMYYQLVGQWLAAPNKLRVNMMTKLSQPNMTDPMIELDNLPAR
jgi:hypothetical protein